MKPSTLALGTPILLCVSPAHAQFLEPVKVIHEIHGESANDQFGWVARRIGDVDGDGVSDFVSTAPTNAEGGTNAGRIYVYSSKTGELLWAKSGAAGARLGIGCDAAGDVNADGVPDVLAGAIGAGEAYVFSGDSGDLLLTVKAEKQPDVFGWAVSTIGDWNGDGHDDFIVGARRADLNGEDSGAVYMYSGKDGSVLRTIGGHEAGDLFGSEISGYSDGQQFILALGAMNAGEGDRGRVYMFTGQEPKLSFIIEADETGVALGRMFITIFGDADGDGVPDVYASDWNDAAKGQNTGRAYVYSTGTKRKLYSWGGDAAGVGFGIGAGDVGDIDADGHADLLIGAWNDASQAQAAGKCYLHSGKNGHVLREITCTVANDTFGFDTTHVGDVDGDGVNDFLVTSAWATIDGKQRCGRVFVISGAAD